MNSLIYLQRFYFIFKIPIFKETLKETNKKRSSLMRIFKYATADVHLIAGGIFFLIAGAVCEAFVPYYTGQVLDSITVQRNFDHFKNQVIMFIAANFLR
jgi:ABC-type multidrug transport system fused ATPase/permease subunit